MTDEEVKKPTVPAPSKVTFKESTPIKKDSDSKSPMNPKGLLETLKKKKMILFLIIVLITCGVGYKLKCKVKKNKLNLTESSGTSTPAGTSE
tara:strand:+ start:246 stop:521 length:276 start_codon:yes stop_codon:yes gene_type:complete